MIRNQTLYRPFPAAIVAGAVGLLLATSVPVHAAAKTYTLSPAWSLAPTTPYDWVSTVNHQRGLAFNPLTGNLITVSRYPATAAAVYVLNSTNGTLKGNLSVTGVKTDMNFPLNLVGVAADGAIYACNLAVNSTTVPADPINNNGPFRIYRWGNEALDPELVYEGDPSDADPIAAGTRFGDNLAVRGAGVDTEILCTTRNTNGLALFRTTDGTNFTHMRIYAPDMALQTKNGLEWGTNNTFYVKSESSALQHFSFDETGMATLVQSHAALQPRGGLIAIDSSRGLLALVRTAAAADLPHEVRLYKKTIGGYIQQDHPEDYRPFPVQNANGNGTGAAVFGNGKLFALSSNNGVVAFDIIEKDVIPQIFWTETGGFDGPGLGSVWMASFEGGGKTPIAVGLNRPIGIDLDYTNRHVYWAEDGSGDLLSKVVRANFDGSQQEVLFSNEAHGFRNAQMLRLDLANGHVYWIDFYAGVLRGKLDGTEYTVIGGHPNAARYTALDLDFVNRHIYYADPTQNGVLFRMDFDGQNNIEIVRNIAATDFRFNAIELDVPNGHIYYTDTGTHEIKRMNLDGSDQIVVLSDSPLTPFDITLAPDDRLYWVGGGDGLRIGSSNRDGSEPILKLVDVGVSAFGIATIPVAPLRMSHLSVAGSVATITWQGGMGPFQLQRRTSLTSGDWENVGSTTTVREATDAVTAGNKFYRVVGN